MVVAPWLGGRSIDAPGRRLRLGALPQRPGWYQFELKGRVATAVAPIDAPSLNDRPKVHGVMWRNRLVIDGAKAVTVHFLPEEEPSQFAPASARRWHGGELLFDGLEFESEAEGQVREALAKGEGLREVKGVAAPLRAAFAFALLEQVGGARNIRFAASEVRGHLARVGEEGRAAADAALEALVTERELAEREMRELRARLGEAQVRADLAAEREARAQRLLALDAQLADVRGRRIAAGRRAFEDDAWEALEKAGARFESARQLGGNQLEVIFTFMDERFISVVDAATLQVIDSGICLGHPPADRMITLESLPAVIKEAIDTDRLVILRAP